MNVSLFVWIFRQKLTSPKWNRFKGVRLRWKDKIRLNNVIWRCWHMQCEYFLNLVWNPALKLYPNWRAVLLSVIMKKKTLVCQFAAPLDVDGHNKPEVRSVPFSVRRSRTKGTLMLSMRLSYLSYRFVVHRLSWWKGNTGRGSSPRWLPSTKNGDFFTGIESWDGHMPPRRRI